MINSPVEEIKNRLDIAEVVGSYIKLQKAGVNYRAPCPFHSEKKPSFFVSPSRQIWHCFGGCGTGGDIFKFVMQIEGVEFGDALRILAQRAGVELKKPSREFVQYQTERGGLLEVCELATRFFEKQLAESSAGKEAKSYLLGRGILEESIKKWRLGYSPDTWEGLTDFLVKEGYKTEEIEKAGLAVKKEIGAYDRFRGRIIFPIFDFNSQVAGFTGRVFKEKDQQETAKYVNTPSTILYDKSKILYGLNKAKVEIRKQNNCILVEGNTDAIMAHQAGTQNTVATSGTALTPLQLKILKRYTDNLILGFDMDVAGETATKRGIDLAQSQGFNIKVLRLPEGKDAAEIIAKDPEEWLSSLKDLRGIVDFYFESAFLNRDSNNPEAKKEISKILLPALKRIPNQIEKSFWVQKLAAKLKVKEGDILEELKKVKLGENYFLEETESVVALSVKSRRELLEERLMILLIKSPQKINLIKDELLLSLGEPCREIILKLKNNPDAQRGRDEPFDRLSLAAEVEEIEEKEIEPEITFCLKEIQSLNIKGKLDEISKDIKYTEDEKNDAKTKDLIQRFSDTASQLTNL